MNKNKKKKMFEAVFMALILVVTMIMPQISFAEDQTISALQVTNLKGNPTSVKAYKIARYDSTLANPYVMVDEVSAHGFSDMNNPTPEEITKIAKLINSGEVSIDTVIELNKTDETTYKNTEGVTPGYYIVIASGSSEYIYNPMLIGASQTTEGVKQSDLSADHKLLTDPVVAKQSVPSVKKTSKDKDSAVKKNTEDVVESNKEIEYDVETKIPSFDKTVFNAPKFIITDKLSEGLTLNKESIKVLVGENPAQEGTDYELNSTSNSYKIEFSSEFIKNNIGMDVKVTYSASLNENAVTNIQQNTNDVKIEYSHDASNQDDLNKKTDKSYNYTFEIDGSIFGDKNIITHEIIKTGEDEWEDQEESHVTDKKPIGGAEFTLTSEDGENIYKATSNGDGLLNFVGLDAGNYTLKEVKPPKGYSLNGKTYNVVITAEYNDGSEEDTGYIGTLRKYTIKIGDKTNTYTVHYVDNAPNEDGIVYKDKVSKITANETETIELDEGTANIDLGVDGDHASEIKNTKLPGLPSTGGMGTYIFTVLGVAIITLAGLLFIKKKNK